MAVVGEGPGLPAIHKAAVCVPTPDVANLAVFKSPTSVHEVPSYFSVTFV